MRRSRSVASPARLPSSQESGLDLPGLLDRIREDRELPEP
jgi:hypothetical protein